MLKPLSPFGIYEKALPVGEDWSSKLHIAKTLGFDFIEMSIDETDNRLARLAWDKKTRLNIIKATLESGIRIPSICLSAHRRFPLGSEDPSIRQTALKIMSDAIQFAQDLGIRVIQLAGYDVYYQTSNQQTRAYFREGLCESLRMASRAQVTLAIEIMDYPLLNSISKALGYIHYFNNPWLQIYPDIGNLSAWENDVTLELVAGTGHMVAIHIKDTQPGVFKKVPFGDGVVNFESCFKTLVQHNYHGPYLIEMWSETAPDPIAEVKKARQWVIEKMQLAGVAMEEYHA